jgi:hypothetical protein
MARLILLYCIAIGFHPAYAQKNDHPSQKAAGSQNDSAAYAKRTIEFITFIRKNVVRGNKLVLVDKPSSLTAFDCLQNLLEDSTFFTPAEKRDIETRAKHTTIKNWSGDLVKNVIIIENDTIDSVFKDPDKGWVYYYKHFGSGFNTFSAPIFLRNNSLCLFYHDNLCGMLCGTGHFELYKKVGNTWKLVRSFCDWIS